MVIYIYIYVYTHTHTCKYIYIYIYIYIYVSTNDRLLRAADEEGWELRELYPVHVHAEDAKQTNSNNK